MVELSPQAQAVLRRQRRRYLARLPDKADELETLWAQIATDGPAAFVDAVHRLAGSAGLHGLDRLQRAAAGLEAELKRQEEETAAYDSAVAELIGMLREEQPDPNRD